jgi:hypothetical protein
MKLVISGSVCLAVIPVQVDVGDANGFDSEKTPAVSTLR